jgi:Zn-finger nucleic acid-binding protein
VDQVICTEQGWSIGQLRDVAVEEIEGQGGCASCGGPLRRGDVEGVQVDLCTRCGGAWLDPGELEALSHGRHLERDKPDALARRYLPTAVQPHKHKRFVTIPSYSVGRGVAGSALLLVGLVTFWLPFISVVAFVGGGALAYGSGAVFDTVERKVAPLTRFVFSFRGVWRDWGDFVAVRVAYERVGSNPASAKARWVVRLMASEGKDPFLVFQTTRRLVAHRFGFQVSQVMGLRVDVPDDDDDA